MTTAIEIAMKMLGEKQSVSFINEELTPTHQRKADKMAAAGNRYHQEQFMVDHAAPGTNDKFQYDKDTGHKVIRIPVSLNQDNAEPSHTVKNFLEEKGFHIRDAASYRSGIVHKSVVTGNPEKGIPYRNKLVAHKIGSVLEKHDAPHHVMQAFQHDPVRVGAGKTDYDIVITNHPHDVYGMSTGRGWTSCADMEEPKGYAAQKMKDEINNHTHVAYLVNRGDNYDKNSIARIAFKHHTALSEKSDSNPHQSHQTLISEKRVYGQAPTDFRTVAEHEMSKLFPIKNDIYMKNPYVYNDSGSLIHVPEGQKVGAESLDAAWKKFPKESKHQLYEHVSLDGKYQAKKLREVQHALKEIVKDPSGRNFQDDISRLRESTYGLDSDQKSNGISRNNTVTDEVLKSQVHKVMQNFDITNPDHAMELRLFDSSHPLRHHVFSGLEKTIPPVKTVNDFVKGNAITKLLGNRSSVGLPFHPEHTLGDDPVKTLGKAGVLKDVDDYRKAYHTFLGKGKEIENWYSLTHRLSSDNVPNAHLAFNEAVEDFRHSYRHTQGNLSRLAFVYHNMTPSARDFYGKEFGHDHQKIIEENSDMINKMYNR